MVEIPRPQALGAFPLPAGFLLIPGGDDHTLDAARESLVAGKLPESWPAALEGHRLAHAGDAEAALAFFDGASVVERYNRFVLAPEGVDVATLREDLGPALAPLVDVVAYSVGLSDVVPEVGEADGEMAAIVVATQASVALDAGQHRRAATLLHAAAVLARPHGAPLAGLLVGNAGMIEQDFGSPDAVEDLRHGTTALDGTDLGESRAELHLRLGMALHEQAAKAGLSSSEAVGHYHSALALVDKKSSPFVWASAHLNLASAYLASPMTEAGDALRNGVAVGSLRAALEVFTREEYPAQWASATVNLANALVYQPSTKQGDNLVEAVEKYEEVLAVRDRDTDPLGRARLLANQGNVLAHLGIFDHAKAKLYEARFLFEEHLDHESVMAVRSVLDEIARIATPKDGRTSDGQPVSLPAPATPSEIADAAEAVHR